MPGPLAIPAAVLLAIGSIMGIDSARNTLNHWINALYPTGLPSIGELIEMRYKGIIDEEQYLWAVRANGLDPDWSDRAFAAGKQVMTLGEMITAFRRGYIDHATMQNKMTEARISPEDQTTLEKISEFFPSPSDLVQFAVREVYTPEIVQKFGMMDDIPEEFLTNAKIAGLPDEQARNFWAAHWALPSPLQGFRMLHRNIINEEELKLLLKSLDVMPFWRDKIVQLSYNPLTRVDVRRMYGLGVLDVEGVEKAYKDVGYNEANAKLMTEFTVKFQNDENKGITRSSVVSAYKKGAITEEELREYLVLLRFSEKVINFWVNSAVYDKIMKEIDDLIDLAIASFANGIITEAEMLQEFGDLGLPATYIEDLKKRATLERRKRTRMPDKDDLIKWLVASVVDPDQFTGKMKDIGFRPSDIDLYIEANPVKETEQ